MSQTLSWLCLFKHVTSVRLPLIARNVWLAAVRASAARSGWAEIHDNRRWHFIANLVSPSSISLHLMVHVGLWLLDQILSPSDSRSILNRGILLVVIAKFKTAAIHVLTESITLLFSLARRSMIGHRHVILPLNLVSDWGNVFHVSICIRAVLKVVLVHWSLHRIIMTMSINHWLHGILVFMHSSHSTIESVLNVFRNWLVNSSFVPISGLEAFGDMLTISSIVLSVDFILLAPPLRVNDWVET